MRILPLIALLLLTACGFQPVYGVNKETSTNVSEQLALVEIGNIPDREGQYLRNDLIDRFYRNGRPASPQYILTLSEIIEGSRNLDVTINSDTTRGQLTLNTSIQLSDKQSRRKIIERNLSSIASYNIIASEFANRVSEQNTRENALNDLGRQIEEQLALYFKRQL